MRSKGNTPSDGVKPSPTLGGPSSWMSSAACVPEAWAFGCDRPRRAILAGRSYLAIVLEDKIRASQNPRLTVSASGKAVMNQVIAYHQDGLVHDADDDLRQIIDATPALIHTGRADGYLDYFNRRWLTYLGASLDDVCGWHWQDFIHPDDLDELLSKWRAAIASGEPLVAESRVRRADGEYRWFLHQKVPVKDEHGNVIKWQGASIEIEDRKRAEDALRRSERFLAEAQRLSKTGSFILNTATGNREWSEESFRIFGIDPTVALTADLIMSRIHPDDRQLVKEIMKRASARGQPFELDHRVVMPDGRIKHIHAVAHAVGQNPDGFEYLGTAMDVTATKLAIQEIQELKDKLFKENIAFKEEIEQSSMFEEIVGTSQPLRRVLAHIEKVAPTESTVLITGETGTGKELIARAVHKRSARADRPFIRVNCAAIPQSLVASELFGHEKGAFTGATQRRHGRFEIADGGTLFLDEIGELPADTQISLLRVLQEKEFERLGGAEVVRVDVRIIAATNRDLQLAIEEGTFRQDLFYRLAVFPIETPSLRERKDDIPLLVAYLVERFASREGKRIENIAKRTLDVFQTYDWPGNIRELQNVIERAVILCEGDTLLIDDTWLQKCTKRAAEQSVPLELSLDTREREIIESALAACKGQVAGSSGAAKRLGIPRSTLESRIKSLGIDKWRHKAAKTRG
jgi:PAS domain S-box-containing protein